MKPLRFGFVTCVKLGLACMEEIAAQGGRLEAAITIPDDKARGKSGRIYLDAHCTALGIPIGKFANINDEAAVAWLREMQLDWLFVIGWSQIARVDVLNSVSRGVIGMHPTLLPKGRGRASVPWAIIKQLPETGVTMFKLDEGVDTGPLLAQERIPLASRETAATLYAKVEEAHRLLMRRAWPLLLSDNLPLLEQDASLATVWPGRTAEDGRLNAQMSVQEADRLVRAVTHPYPGAFIDAEGCRWRIWAAEPARACGTVHGKPFEFADGTLVATDFVREIAN